MGKPGNTFRKINNRENSSIYLIVFNLTINQYLRFDFEDLSFDYKYFSLYPPIY